MNGKNYGGNHFMAKPIEATPVLRGQDLVNLASSLLKAPTEAGEQKRISAYEMLKRVSK